MTQSVFFEENNEFHIKSRKLLGDYDTPSMIKFLLKSGVAKNEKQALIILLLTIFICIGLAVWVIKPGTQNNFVVDKYGRQYTVDEYIKLVEQGRDPLEE